MNYLLPLEKVSYDKLNINYKRMKYLLSEIAKITNGKLVGADNVISNIVFDSRNVFDNDNSLFVAMVGDMFDGHDFVEQLIGRGISSFITSKDFTLENSTLGYVKVTDSLKALQQLAAHHRDTLSYPIVAITGSNGKSIVKEWIYQLLCTNTIFRSPKSYNSQLGVALSILMATGDEDMAIIEAGISERGEMSKLRDMIKPYFVIVTNIGEAHQENFNSQEEKLEEKLELIKNCYMVMYNGDNILVSNKIKEQTPKNNRFSWGVDSSNNIVVKKSLINSDIEFTFEGRVYNITLPMNDKASRENILHAISFIAFMGADLDIICRRANNISAVAMRLELMDGIGDSKIINDSYNNDYNSLSVALSYMQLVASGAEKIIILSDILQSGRENSTLYRDVSTLINSCEVSMVIAIGNKVGDSIKKYYSGNVSSYQTTDEFLSDINLNDFHNKTVLIKGSRKFQFERISSKLEDKQHSTMMEVNIDALLHNYRYYKSKIATGSKIVAMVKALSYGSGSYEIALTLQNSGVDYLAVAYLDEGVTLRKKGIYIPIIILNSNPRDYDEIINNELEPEIYNIYSLELFIESCKHKDIENYPIHIKLDTGMHRMGFQEEDIYELSNRLKSETTVKVSSIFSHFSCSDTPEQDAESLRQIELYRDMSSKIVQYETIKHICNSAGVERFPQAHFDMVRIGLGLYGISSNNNDKLLNVSTLHSRILQIKDIKKGDYVGYNMRGIADKDMKIATLSIGYADGLNRKFGCGRWQMKLNGKFVPTIGNISMDTCSIDITGVEAHEGDKVSVFTSSEDIKEMARIIDTIPYEILTSISARIKRIFIRD